MNRHQIHTPEQALVYLADCTLATVSSMAMLKSKSKGEFERQISIAQSAIEWINDFKIPVEQNSRPQQVLALSNRSVKEWAEKYSS